MKCLSVFSLFDVGLFMHHLVAESNCCTFTVKRMNRCGVVFSQWSFYVLISCRTCLRIRDNAHGPIRLCAPCHVVTSYPDRWYSCLPYQFDKNNHVQAMICSPQHFLYICGWELSLTWNARDAFHEFDLLKGLRYLGCTAVKWPVKREWLSSIWLFCCSDEITFTINPELVP